MATVAAQQKTASTHRTVVLRGAHQLDIVGYTTRRHLGADNVVRSCTFDAGSFHWTLLCRFRETLTKRVNLASIALELSRNRTDKAVVAAASLRIDDPASTGLWPAAEWRSEEPNVFPAQSSTPVVWELAVPDAFRDHEARYVDVEADRLTVHCTVDVFQEESADNETATRSCQLVSVPPPPSLCKDIHRLREKMWWPDVTFAVGEAKIQAHKLVLAMRSPVFAAEFRGGMKEKTMRRVTIHDMSASTFRAMLHFIYTDELPEPKNRKCRVAMARDLLVAADLYDLERLRLMCGNILAESITIGNVMGTLMLVHNRSSCHQLEASCVEYMASDPDVYEAVEATEDYKELDKTCPSFINDITKKVAKRAVARNRPSSSSSSSNNRETTSTSRYNPSAVMTGTHEFRIENLSAVRKTFVLGQCIKSGLFQAGGYPSGFDEKFKDHISVYVRPQISDDTNVKALVGMAAVDPTRGSPMLPFRSFSHIYDGKKCEGWGWVDLITVASAKSDYIAHDGSFTLHCRVDVTVDSCTSNTIRDTATAASPVPVPPSNMSWHLEKLLASEEGWDVEFMVEEKEIHAHGLVIATRSQALHELVESTTGTDHVNIDDMKAST